jgi:hypothetical protein
MNNENEPSGYLIYLAVVIGLLIISVIIRILFNIEIPIFIPAVDIASIIGWLHCKPPLIDTSSDYSFRVVFL